MRFFKIIQNLFDHQFASTIRVDGILRVILRDGDFNWFAVDGTRRRKYEILDVMFNHFLQECYSFCNIVDVVFSGVIYRLSHIAIGREVHDS